MKKKKKRISVAAAKDKGRRLQNEVCQCFSEISGIPFEKDGDIEGRPMGQSGVDVCFRGCARDVFPYAIECKYQESWSLPAWIKQAQANCDEGTDWLLFFRKNRHKTIVAMEADVFFELLRKIIDKPNKKLKLRSKHKKA